MADEMELLKEWIKTSKNIVFFGGAGVSTESNIPDFRSTDGPIRTSSMFRLLWPIMMPIKQKRAKDR